MEDIAAIFKTDAAEFLQEDYSKYRIKQSNRENVTVNGVAVHYSDFEPERKVWQALEKTQREVIEAKDALIAAKEETIEAMRSAMKKNTT